MRVEEFKRCKILQNKSYSLIIRNTECTSREEIFQVLIFFFTCNAAKLKKNQNTEKKYQYILLWKLLTSIYLSWFNTNRNAMLSTDNICEKITWHSTSIIYQNIKSLLCHCRGLKLQADRQARQIPLNLSTTYIVKHSVFNITSFNPDFKWLQSLFLSLLRRHIHIYCPYVLQLYYTLLVSSNIS